MYAYDAPMIVLTSRFGTVEMWDWEIITFLRGEGMNIFSPDTIQLAKTVIRALAVKQRLKKWCKRFDVPRYTGRRDAGKYL